VPGTQTDDNGLSYEVLAGEETRQLMFRFFWDVTPPLCLETSGTKYTESSINRQGSCPKQ